MSKLSIYARKVGQLAQSKSYNVMLASEEDKCKAVICDNAVMPTGVKNGAALNRTARDAAPPDA